MLAMEAHSRIMAWAEPTPTASEESHLLSVQGDIGVINIRGPLTNRESPLNAVFGITSYGEIRRAVMQAAENPGVKGILLDIDSGGGAVNGVADTGDLIKAVDRQIKPVWAFTDGTMASAAYWLGSSARQVFASRTSVTGSIGVITTHMEYSKMLKEEGIGVTVVRAGEYKALANSVEPLSSVAQRQLQDQLNAAYEVFIGHVADARGTSVKLADEKMGQGREFFGEQAVTAGLVDGILPFDAVIDRFSNKVLDNRQVTHSNNGQFQQRGPDMKKALTAQQIAALAAGAEQVAAAETVPQAAAEVKQADQQPAAAAAAASEAPAAAAAATETPAAPAAANGELISYLQQQLASSQEQLIDLRMQVKQANETITSMKTCHDGLMAIAVRSIGNMKVALGLPATDASKQSPESLLADHAATAEAFQKAFKAGGVAAVSAAEEPKKTGLIDPHHLRRVQATRLSSN
jgi:signal peptide peptidase SppA